MQNLFARYWGVLFARLQSFLKFILAFRKEFSYWGTRSKFVIQTYVFMIDGKTIHGGMSDRFRGAMSVYSYYTLHLKPFVGFYMVSMAEKCFIHHIGEMFKYTRFAKTAALVGGKELETINEE